MFTLPTTNHPSRSLLKSRQTEQQEPPAVASEVATVESGVRQQMANLGVSKFACLTMESRYLPEVINKDEKLGGVAYGWTKDGFVMMAATDKRIIFIDKKPFMVTEDDITYNVVSGVSFGHVGLLSTVTLHTRIKDYKLKTFSMRSASNFASYVEHLCIENNERGGMYDNANW